MWTEGSPDSLLFGLVLRGGHVILPPIWRPAVQQGPRQLACTPLSLPPSAPFGKPHTHFKLRPWVAVAVHGGSSTHAIQLEPCEIKRAFPFPSPLPPRKSTTADDRSPNPAVDATSLQRISRFGKAGNTTVPSVRNNRRAPLKETPRNILQGGASRLQSNKRAEPPDQHPT